MITKIVGEQPFQVLTNNFSISPSSEGYTLQISADGVNYSNLFTVGAGVTRLVTGVAANSYYKLSGNQSQVSINWMKMCVTEGQGGGNAGELEPVTAFPVGAPEGTVVALASGDTVGVYQYDGTDWVAVGGDMSEYYTKSQTDAAITAATDAKLDTSAYTSYTASTEGKEEVIASALTSLHDTKQDNLVSGENIKTINNQSILGSGNITIQGGGGGSVVELTQAEYNALVNPDSGTTYIITDAPVVDLNDYAPASGLTELSGTVQTINSNYATKQNVTANTSLEYFPAWNNQGVITGNGNRAYTKASQINGTTYYVYSERSDTRPNIYAPTSAGTAGQPLLSNGSGGPVWGGYKFAFISQSQYDALTTPDSTTIYFIIDPN